MAGAWLITLICLKLVGGAAGGATGVAWLGSADLFLATGLLLVIGVYLFAVGKRATILRALVVPLGAAVIGWPAVVYAGITQVRARLGPGRDFFRGMIYLRSGDLERAALTFDRYLSRHPSDVAALDHATLVFLKIARYEDALRYLDAALSRDANPELTLLRSLVLFHSGMLEEGLAEIELALAKKPKSWIHHFYRAQMLIEGGRADEALAVLKGPTRPFKCPTSWYLLALAFTTKGESGKAADACSRALPIVKVGRKYGPMPWEQMMAAWLLIQMDRLEEASRAATWTGTKNPGDHEALVMQAEIHRRRGEPGQALRCLEQAAGRSPFSVIAAARDPGLGPLAAIPGFPDLLERATRDWQARLFAIRHRPGVAEDGAVS